MNGDGKSDIIVANNTSAVSVLLGNGNGTFQAQQTFATGANSVSVALVDVNGDSKPDIVAANESDDTVSVLLGNGNGTFQAQQTFAAGVNPLMVALVDVSGDGKLDMLVANEGSNTVSLLLGNGNGTFQAQQTFATGSNPDWVAVGDVNGDGIPDLVIANVFGDSVSVLLGNGNGTFLAQQTFNALGGLTSVVLGDVNGDGDADLVEANRYSSTVSVLFGDGTGNFPAQQTFAVGSRNSSVALGDVNGDGKPDLVLTNGIYNTVSVLLNSDNGDFTGQIYVHTTGATTNLAITGIPATATVHSGLTFTLTALDQSINIVAGYTGTVHFTTTDAGSGSVVPADYTFVPADGGVHVFTAGVTLVSPGTQTITVYDTALNALSVSASVSVHPAAATHFAVNAPPTLLTNSAFNFTVTALDPFGNTATNYTGTVHFGSSDPLALLPANARLTNGVGTFSAKMNTGDMQTITATDSKNAAVSGNAVINVVNPAGTAPFVQSISLGSPPGAAINASTVTFTVTFSQAVTGINLADFALVLGGTATGTLTQVTAVSAAVYSVAVGGITGLGTLGLNFVDNRTIEDHSGKFLTQLTAADLLQSQQTFAAGAYPVSVALGDVNGDGKPDLIVPNFNNSAVSVLLGNGNGTFQAPQQFAVAQNPVGVTLADVNGDGKSDLVVLNRGGGVSVLLGNGNGTFQTPKAVTLVDGVNGVALGDVNGDGKLDIVAADEVGLSNSFSVLLGNGNGTFQAQQTYPAAS